MNQAALKEILNNLRRGLAQLLADQLEAVYLYGSHARGEAHPDSDVDILVVLKGAFDTFEMIQKTGSLVAGLSLENDLVISLAFTSSQNYHNRNTPFLMNIQREGIRV